MNDPYIEDITCNGHEMPLFVNHRMYGSVRTNVVFKEVELNNFVMRMAQSSGRHISVLQPIRDATLSDGSRVNLTLGKEVTRKGSTFTIRRFKSNPVSVIDLMNYKTYNSEVLAYLWIIVEYQRSVLASGGTASGKTTTLNALGSFIRPEYKIVSIEDTAEINLMHPNWTQSITRAGFGGGEGVEEAGNIQLYDLLKAALRQRPEYIIVGEVRGAEASTLFQAISVGHPCMGTIHAGSMKELVSRVESEPMNVPRNLFSSLDVVIFNAMIKVGEHFIRRALSIVELVEVDPDRGDIITNPVFKWNAYNDDYIFSGDSAMFEDISQEFGIEIPYLRKEMETRAQYLDYLQNNNIKEYKDVVRYIRRYARDKDDLMEQEDKERKSHSEADIEGKPGVEESLTIEEVVQNIEDVGSVV
jgi:flagellar protein FlaI